MYTTWKAPNIKNDTVRDQLVNTVEHLAAKEAHIFINSC